MTVRARNKLCQYAQTSACFRKAPVARAKLEGVGSGDCQVKGIAGAQPGETAVCERRRHAEMLVSDRQARKFALQQITEDRKRARLRRRIDCPAAQLDRKRS